MKNILFILFILLVSFIVLIIFEINKRGDKREGVTTPPACSTYTPKGKNYCPSRCNWKSGNMFELDGCYTK